MGKRAMGRELTIRKSDGVSVHHQRDEEIKSHGLRVDHGKKSDGVSVHHHRDQEKKSHGLRVDHGKKSDGARVDHKKERWGER